MFSVSTIRKQHPICFAIIRWTKSWFHNFTFLVLWQLLLVKWLNYVNTQLLYNLHIYQQCNNEEYAEGKQFVKFRGAKANSETYSWIQNLKYYWLEPHAWPMQSVPTSTTLTTLTTHSSETVEERVIACAILVSFACML